MVVIFVLAALPFAATFSLYYPDERHYSDGAVQMLAGQGWLIPHTAAGTVRLEKPPLAYWLIAACYKVFGVSAFSSHLPFLLAGCGTIWLTYRLGRKLTQKTGTALIAAAVVASHPQFFLACIRSIPDSLLVFFVTLSAFGFLRLIVFEEFTLGAYCLAYGGAAGAALSKGLLGFLIVGFAWAFVIWKERSPRAVLKLIHWPSFLPLMLLTAGWFIYIFAAMPQLAWREFFGDQVTGNLHGHFWSPLVRIPIFALILLLNFLPWSATVLETLFRRRRPLGLPPAARDFCLAWTGLLIVGFSVGSNLSLRYLLPAAPLAAIVVAAVLENAQKPGLLTSIPRGLTAALGLLVLLDAVLLFVIWQWSLPLLLPLFALFLLLIFALRREVEKSRMIPAEALALALLLGWPVVFIATLPVNVPDRSQTIARALRGMNAPKQVLLVGDVKLASRLRVELGESWTVTQSNRVPADATAYTRMVVSGNDLDKMSPRDWTLQPVASKIKVPPARELWSSIRAGRLPQALLRNGDLLWLAIRK